MSFGGKCVPKQELGNEDFAAPHFFFDISR